ncbi:MAG TPA: hypothetical protein VFE93_08310 [Myxococcaceae bacterium]|nr:hypothetical protein [Myxococcaceae bacterium]
MMRNLGGILGGALLVLAACGPMDDGGGGVVGDVCMQQADCVSNACCGNGTGVVNASRAPSCPAPSACPGGSPDPTNQTLLNGCGTPFCDGTGHCVVARQC